MLRVNGLVHSLYYVILCVCVYWTAEGVYVDTRGKVTKNVVIQWGEVPTSVAYISSGQLLGWGLRAIEVRSAETGHLDGVFMHKREQRFKFLCERNDKARFLLFDWLCFSMLSYFSYISFTFNMYVVFLIMNVFRGWSNKMQCWLLNCFCVSHCMHTAIVSFERSSARFISWRLNNSITSQTLTWNANAELCSIDSVHHILG